MTVSIRELPNSNSVVCRSYKTTTSDRAEILRMVANWKQNGIVSETVSPYTSPVLLINQVNGKPQLCVNYRTLNKQTLRQYFSLTYMLKQLESLIASYLFTQLHLANGSLQIPLTTEAEAKTAFIISDTTGQFNRMPFGPSGAVPEFTKLMQ